MNSTAVPPRERRLSPCGRVLIHSALLVLVWAPAPSVRAEASGPTTYLDTAQPLDARVRDLVDRLTLDEKAGLMKNIAPGVPRLGIAPYDWWNEALHGVARAGEATVFPQAIGLAATWDEAGIRNVGDIIGTEARAKYHDAIRHGIHERYRGLTFWSPNINIFRDPRWGRGQETYGEDPFLTARIGTAFVRGMQGDDPRYLKTAACAKHLAVHSGPESTRYTANVSPEPADLWETYLPAFEALVRDGRVESVMTAYNSLYGQPCTVSPVIYDALRDWGFDGHVVSDCGAVYILFEKYGIARDFAEAEAMAMHAGLCLRCGDGPAMLAEAVRSGLIPESEVDERLTALLRTWFRLGMFDPPEYVSYARIPLSSNNSPEHATAALETARRSLVLLKNDGTLPLDPGRLRRVLVVGPNADSLPALLGNYHGTPTAPVTLLAGLRAALAPAVEVDAALGCDHVAAAPGFAVLPRTALNTGDFSTADDGDVSGLQVAYFANTTLAGEPVAHGRSHQIEFSWNDRAPAAAIDPRAFSARWTGFLTTGLAGTYDLVLEGTGRMRLFLDDDLVIDGWIHGPKRLAISRKLGERRTLPVRIEFAHDAAEDAAPGSLKLSWQTPPADAAFAGVTARARAADAVIFVGGITAQLEGEDMRVDYEGFAGGDRSRIELPTIQQHLITALAGTGKPLILVNLSGSAVALGDADAAASAIVHAWYPGQSGGTAVADVLLGRFNPSGRLPVTFYRATADLPEFSDYRMAGRTYRYFQGTPLYAFGHGLSYTTFGYAGLRASPRAGGGIDVSVDVTNTGARAGDEVVQVYVREPDEAHPRAARSLAAFARVALAPGERRTVSLTVEPAWMRRWDAATGGLRVPGGDWRVEVGASSNDLRASAHVAIPPSPAAP